MAALQRACDVGPAGVLALDDVAFAYPHGGEVVSELSLCLTPACATVILGANGTGKSTIGRLATGQLRPTHGVVRTGISPVPARSIPRLGAIAHGRRHDSGEDSAAALPSATWRARVAATLEVDTVLGRRRATLSAGERQRRSLALALLVEPDVLVLDEPCADLDEVHREALIDLLTIYREHRGAVLLLTSDVTLAHAVSDRIGVLSGGHVEWRHADDAVTDVRSLQRACLRPSSSRRSRRAAPHSACGPVTSAHTARLAAVVRDRLGLGTDSPVVVQQVIVGGRDSAAPTVVVSVPSRGPECWVFDGPLIELSPHAVSAALALNLEGHTHVAVH